MKPSNFVASTIRSIVGLTVVSLAVVGVTGCGASTQYEALAGDTAARPQRDARTVEVRFNAPGRDHKEVGVISASFPKTEDTADKDFARAVREEAAAKGCDGVIMSDGSSAHMGALAPLDTDRPFKKGICIVYSDGKGADRDAVTASNAWIDGNAPREQTVTVSADAPPASCTAIGTIKTDPSLPTEGATRAILRRRARERQANYVQVQATSFTAGDNGGEASAYSCPSTPAAASSTSAVAQAKAKEG